MDRRKRRVFRLALASTSFAFGAALLSAVGGFAGACLFIGFSGIAVWILTRRSGVPILVYHSISPNPAWLPWANNISVRPEVFAAHMAHLKATGANVISSQELKVARRDQQFLPPDCVVLQFDDGYLDNGLCALPVLKSFGFPATIFVSTDFIDPSDTVRLSRKQDGHTDYRGYLNASELRMIDADPLFEIAAHGADHSRLPIASEPIATITEQNWSDHLEQIWHHMDGNKSQWFHKPISDQFQGIKVYPSASALTGFHVSEDNQNESKETQAERIKSTLATCRSDLEHILGRNVRFLCWPFDEWTPRSFELAKEMGFELFTGGHSDNRPSDNWQIQSRVHINDFAAGPAPVWVEVLVFRAKLEVARGNLLWWPVLALAKARRSRFFKFKHVPTNQSDTPDSKAAA